MMLLVLRSKDAGSLGHPLSRQFMVSVYDDTRRNTQARKIAERFIEQVLEKKRFSIEDVHVQGFPFEQPRTDRKDVAPMALCLVAEMVAGSRGVDVQSDVLHRPFSILPRQRLASAFAWLRGTAVRAGPKDVLPLLEGEQAGAAYIRCWMHEKADVDGALAPAASQVKAGSPQAAIEPVATLEQRVFTALTWNVCSKCTEDGAFEFDIPQHAPLAWVGQDKLQCIIANLCRWRPDFLALQEWPTADLRSISEAEKHSYFQGYHIFTGRESHCGYVHILVKQQGAVRECSPLKVRGKGVAVLVKLCNQPGCTAKKCVHKTSQVLLVSVHLTPGPTWGNSQGRIRQLQTVLESARLCLEGEVVDALLVLGDFNLRQEEEPEMLKIVEAEFGKKEKATFADYSGPSWDPLRNRFKADSPKVQGYAFDRICTHGNAYAAACLVGQAQRYDGTSKFALSDHFAVRAVLAFGVSDDKINQPLRPGCVQARVDDLLLKFARDEKAWLLSEEVRARQEFLPRLEKQLRTESELSRKELDEQQADRLQRRARRKSQWDSVFGSETSFFSWNIFPSTQHTISLVQSVALQWRVAGTACKVNNSGFKNAGNTCYVSVVAQMLLRLPPVNRFLAKHSRGCQNSECCAICLLWKSRTQLGKQVVPTIAENRSVVHTDFADGRQHDAVEFLEAWIGQAKRSEIASGSFVPLPDLDVKFPTASPRMTSLDSLFLLMEERRAYCKTCSPERTASVPRLAFGIVLDLWSAVVQFLIFVCPCRSVIIM